jgi:hypothetical protein
MDHLHALVLQILKDCDRRLRQHKCDVPASALPGLRERQTSHYVSATKFFAGIGTDDN